MRGKKKSTTAQKASAWETAMPLLRAMYGEFKELSKKKPDDAVSKEKIKVVNRLLEKCREVLANEDSLSFLDLLDEDELPQHSDVVLMLSQYVAAMNQYRTAYYGWDGVDDVWFT
jgi:hypothetical protein